MTPPRPWADDSSAQSLFEWRIFFLMSKLNFPILSTAPARARGFSSAVCVAGCTCSSPSLLQLLQDHLPISSLSSQLQVSWDKLNICLFLGRKPINIGAYDDIRFSSALLHPSHSMLVFCSSSFQVLAAKISTFPTALAALLVPCSSPCITYKVLAPPSLLSCSAQLFLLPCPPSHSAAFFLCMAFFSHCSCWCLALE